MATGHWPHNARVIQLKQEIQMANQQLRDRYGCLIGTILPLSGGRSEIRDAYGMLKGTYDPTTNQTRDAYGQLVASGNLLSSLL